MGMKKKRKVSSLQHFNNPGKKKAEENHRNRKAVMNYKAIPSSTLSSVQIQY